MTTREALKVSDLDVIASTLSHHARWLLRIRKELWELAEESSHEQEAYEVRKRLKEILIPPDDELEEAEAQAVRDAMPDPLAQRCLATAPAAFPCGIIECGRMAGHDGPHTFDHPEHCGCDECSAARPDYF